MSALTALAMRGATIVAVWLSLIRIYSAAMVVMMWAFLCRAGCRWPLPSLGCAGVDLRFRFWLLCSHHSMRWMQQYVCYGTEVHVNSLNFELCYVLRTYRYAYTLLEQIDDLHIFCGEILSYCDEGSPWMSFEQVSRPR